MNAITLRSGKTIETPERSTLRVQKQKQDKQFAKFSKKLHINIPFAEALEQMSKYVKFMKEILSNKRKLQD
ncbi:hypothetical protein L6164_028484 [Bauhinia variegata]|uniref:Uncharacterized protein n=1 Tax=Bauhinia variegata TaxID=167791 RepID=A0ACB9L5Q3_BAUVA|nr:hypothetical protein L6164_028484 [Bauhinia variegata]